MSLNIVVSPSSFGWGSVGKAVAILDCLDKMTGTLEINVYIVGSNDVSSQISLSLPGMRVIPSASTPDSGDVSLVINDPLAADRLGSDLDAPVVYVDSLPYLRRLSGDVPRACDRYLAQRFGDELDPFSPLSDFDIEWIDPIILSQDEILPWLKPVPEENEVVISVGGLQSPLTSGDDYLSAAVVPIVDALISSGAKVKGVVGNLSSDWCDKLRPVVDHDAVIGSVSVYDFARLISSGRLIFSSPGSTSLFQLASSNSPTVLLPPQNWSQFLNADIFRNTFGRQIIWPTEMLSRESLDIAFKEGEDAVLHMIYSAITAADNSVSRIIADQAEIYFSNNSIHSKDRLSGKKYQGAEQVSEIIMKSL